MAIFSGPFFTNILLAVDPSTVDCGIISLHAFTSENVLGDKKRSAKPSWIASGEILTAVLSTEELMT